MFITVINDCSSQNEIARQETRLMGLFGQPISFVAVDSDLSSNATLEAAGILVDVLDAAEEAEGMILVNSAPRGEQKVDGYNGTPFCYFSYKNLTVISTVRGLVLSLVKKLKVTDSVKLVSVDDVCHFAADQGLLSNDLAAYIPKSQFRSFDFTPRLAHWLYKGVEVPNTHMGLEKIEDAPRAVWYIDAFGNAKTTLLASEVPGKVGDILYTSIGKFTLFERLKDLPKGETALYTGSSGLGSQRFMEIATQMGRAEKTLGIEVGTLFDWVGDRV